LAFPSRPCLEEVLPSVCCLQCIFLLAKPKAAREPHCLSLVVMTGSFGLCADMMSSIKAVICNVSLSHQALAIGNMHKKFGDNRTCSSEDIIADRRTDMLISPNTPNVGGVITDINQS